jgi:putative ABC transport system permease protein
MWRNYLTVGIRALAKNKTYTFINIFGLALGLAACLMILIYIRYETTFENWLPEAERTYQFQQHYTERNTGEQTLMQMNSYVAGGALKKDFPQVENVVYAMSAAPTVLQNGQASTSEDVWYVDGNLFDVISLPILQGDPGTALRNPGSAVLTRSEAVRRFGTPQALGKMLTLVMNGEPVDHRVTAVVEDLPRNSHLSTNMIVRYDPRSLFADSPEFFTNWTWQQGWIYARLRPGADAAAINAALPAWEKRNIPDETTGSERSNPGQFNDWALVNVRDVHLGPAQSASMRPGNDPGSIATFAVVAVMILGMACVNFVNLATARASQRAREVALRKVLGANRRQLIVQFMTESMVVVVLAMLIALALVELVLPALSGFLEADLQLSYFGEGGMLPGMLGLTLLVGLAGGLYPAFYLSRFQPAKVLKANKSAADASGTGRLRNALVVAQFAVSIGLIICTAIVYSQTEYAQSVDPGYRRDGLIQIENVGATQLRPVVRTLQEEIAKLEGVDGAAKTNMGVSTGLNSTTNVQLPGSPTSIEIGNYTVDEHFFPTMDIRLLAGRNFSEGQALDNSALPPNSTDADEQALVRRGLNVIVNDSGAKLLGFRDPAAAIGKQVLASFVSDENGLVPATIVGVVNDSRFRSVRDPIQPTVFRYRPEGQNWMVVRYSANDPSAVRGRIEGVWKRLAPDVPFEAEFADEIVADLYQAETSRAQIFAGFALLAVVIGCLGLFGLASYTAERRTKEIGIRKVLGATVRDIVKLLAWQFSKPVIIANLIAWPVAWWVMRDWLNTFDARIPLGPTPFVLAGILALAIAIGTVASHAVKVARLNPIHALRYE